MAADNMFLVFNGYTNEFCCGFSSFAEAKAYANCQHSYYLVYSQRTAKWCTVNSSRSLPSPTWSRWDYSDSFNKLLDKA